MFLQGGPIRQAKLTNYFQDKSETPLMIAIDAEWGVAMRLDSSLRFPWNMTLGAIQDSNLIYQMGEEVKLTIYAYDSNAMPLTDARIQIDVSPDQQPTFQLSAIEIGDGIYGVDFTTNTDGSYTIKAVASVGSDQIEIRVESPTVEFEKPYLDQDLMMQLAESTGGFYRPLAGVNSAEFADLIPDQRKPVFEIVAHQLWDHPLILILAVGLLGAEWFLRKRRGLV